MSDHKDRVGDEAGKSESEFFTVGPPLHAVRPGYVRRAADDVLFESIVGGQDAYVFAPDRSGKTSLIAATSARLQNNGYLVANLDLAQIGERDAGTDSGRWYYSIAYRLLRQLRVKVDLQSWWQDKTILSNRQRLFEFYIEILLANTRKPVAVFIDELQCIEGLPFAQHLLQSISAVNKARATEPEFSRLSFVLSGECDPQILVADPELSPFGFMRAVRLDDFDRASLDIYATELNLSPEDAALALDRIYYWANGQPYLTQKLARIVARERIGGDIRGHVDRIVQHQFAARSSTRNEPHLAHIHRRIVADRKRFEGMLNTYGRIRKGVAVDYDPESQHQRVLLALGIVVQDAEGTLRVRNRLYESAFTARWANENLPLHWRGPAVAAAVLLFLTAIPFWYTQLLPKPYTRVLTSTTLDLESIADAYVNLRSFPGHVETADRLFVNLLEFRARSAADGQAIALIDAYARRVAGRPQLADQLTAAYWDRQADRALRNERRDEALIAALESLILATPARRRLASTLIGEDYPLLIGTVIAQDAERLVFNAEDQLLTVANGARMSQWTLAEGKLVSRPSWSVSSLEVTPLLRRVVVDRTGSVSRIGLRVNVSHSRLDDIRMRLIAPSGRATELAFDAQRSSANDEVRFAAFELAGLNGESLSGTWTLSIRDEATGVAGHLIGWSLSLNSQVLVENFERGLDIPEPVERESDNLWLSSDGRYAISRAQQSDSARLWDLAYAEPARTIAVPASEQVLGLGPNAEFVATVAQNAVNLWDTRTGRRRSSIDVGATMDIQLTSGGRDAVVRRSNDTETIFERWDLAGGVQVASISVAGAPALASVDPDGTHLAVADYDQAVRIWDFASGDLLAQLDLRAQPSSLELGPGGRALAVMFGAQGLALWRTDRPERPLLSRSGNDGWGFAFSPSGERFLAGSGRQGFQIYRTEDGRASGPALGSSFLTASEQFLAFSNDERIVVTADASGRARFWNAPRELAAAAEQGSVGAVRWPWRETEDLVAMLSPGGQRLAVGDNDGHVHIVSVTTAQQPDVEELSFLGHRGAVRKLTFSPDGSLVASAGGDGTIRVWDAVSGLPRPYRATTQSPSIDELRFSQSGGFLAALLGQHIWIIDVDSGAIVADTDLGEPHADVAFGAGEVLYLAGDSGTLRSLVPDRLGNWSLRDVWQGPYALRRLRVSPVRQLMILADARHVVQVFDIGKGTIGTARLDLPDRITDILFSRNESQVLLRTSRWVHRADISRSGVLWRAAIRAPQALPGSAMVFDGRAQTASAGNSATDEARAVADRGVLLLTREAGLAKVAELDFAHSTGAVLFGARTELLAEWRHKLGLDTLQ